MNSGGFLASLQNLRLGKLTSMHGLSLASRLISARYTLAVGAQALVSGFHFALNLVLVRQISQYDYGIFAFAFVLAMFAQAINNALISTPLTVYTPVIKDTEARSQQENLHRCDGRRESAPRSGKWDRSSPIIPRKEGRP